MFCINKNKLLYLKSNADSFAEERRDVLYWELREISSSNLVDNGAIKTDMPIVGRPSSVLEQSGDTHILWAESYENHQNIYMSSFEPKNPNYIQHQLVEIIDVSSISYLSFNTFADKVRIAWLDIEGKLTTIKYLAADGGEPEVLGEAIVIDDEDIDADSQLSILLSEGFDVVFWQSVDDIQSWKGAKIYEDGKVIVLENSDFANLCMAGFAIDNLGNIHAAAEIIDDDGYCKLAQWQWNADGEIENNFIFDLSSYNVDEVLWPSVCVLGEEVDISFSIRNIEDGLFRPAILKSSINVSDEDEVVLDIKDMVSYKPFESSVSEEGIAFYDIGGLDTDTTPSEHIEKDGLMRDVIDMAGIYSLNNHEEQDDTASDNNINIKVEDVFSILKDTSLLADEPENYSHNVWASISDLVKDSNGNAVGVDEMDSYFKLERSDKGLVLHLDRAGNGEYNESFTMDIDNDILSQLYNDFDGTV